MRKHKSKFTILILLILFLLNGLAITSCSNNTSNHISSATEKETSQSDTSKDYRQFDLTMDNFAHFFYFKEYPASPLNGSTDPGGYEVIGVLNYAYYDNVVVTFDVDYEYHRYTGEYSITLNAAGYVYFPANDKNLLTAIGCTNFKRLGDKKVTLTNITGTIILFN